MHKSPTTDPVNGARREFLRTATAAVLLIGVRWSGAVRAEPGKAPAPDAWVRLGADGRIALVVAKAEMGQGVHTALAMILADELDVDWAGVEVVQAEIDPARYDHLTVGSTSVQSLWEPLRRAAAAAREQLILAAAARWGVASTRCAARSGTVTGPDGRLSTYADLIEAAAKLPPIDATTVPLRSRAEFRLVGTPVRRIEAPDKISGRARYGIDVRQPDQVYAVVARCPYPGGSLKSVDSTAAAATPGVIAIVTIGPQGRDAFTRGGVAVVASNSWSALRGREQLRTEWNRGPGDACDSARIHAALARNVAAAGRVVLERQGVRGCRARRSAERRVRI